MCSNPTRFGSFPLSCIFWRRVARLSRLQNRLCIAGGGRAFHRKSVCGDERMSLIQTDRLNQWCGRVEGAAAPRQVSCRSHQPRLGFSATGSVCVAKQSLVQCVVRMNRLYEQGADAVRIGITRDGGGGEWGGFRLSSFCPTTPSVGKQTDGADAEQDERGGLGNGCQEKGILLPTGIASIANNLPEVDGSHLQCPAGGRINERVQISHRPIAVEESVVVAAACVGIAHHQPTVVRTGCGARRATERTQISHRPIAVEESVTRVAAALYRSTLPPARWR